MSTPDHSAASHPTTLAELRQQVLSSDLPVKRRQDIASAIAMLARAIGRPLDAVPTAPAALRPLICGRSPAQMGFKPGRWRNVRSLVNAGLAHFGLVQITGRLDSPLSPDWATLLEKDMPKDTGYRLARFGRWCSREDIPAESVDDAVLARFSKAQEDGSLVDDPKRRTREIAVMWNRCAASHFDWPQQRLTVPDHRLYYTPDWNTYPESLLAEVELWLTFLAGGYSADLLDEGSRPGPLRPATLANRRCILRLYLGALVLSGEDPATMVDLQSVVTAARARIALSFFVKRTGGKANHHTAQIARLVLGIARHWLRVEPKDLELMRGWVRKLTPKRTGMTEKNKKRIRPFLSDDLYGRLVDLPMALCEEVKKQQGRMTTPNTALAGQVQTAVLLQILLLVPLRMKNLAGLRIGTELVCLPDGKMFIDLTEADTKNSEPFEAELIEEAAAIVRCYIENYRPILNKGGDWLFPGRAAGQRKSHDRLRDQITRAMADYCGVEIHPHAFRHLAAYQILKRSPAAYGMVQRVLGHKQLDTTMRFYTGLEGAAARKHFENMVVNASAAGRAPSSHSIQGR